MNKKRIANFLLRYGYDKETYEQLKPDMYTKTVRFLLIFSAAIALLFLCAIFYDFGKQFLWIDLSFIGLFLLYLIPMKTKLKDNMVFGQIYSYTFIALALGIALVDSTILTPNYIGVFLPIFIALIAIMTTGQPVVVNTILTVAAVTFMYVSYLVKDFPTFQEDCFDSIFFLCVAFFMDYAISKSRIQEIIDAKKSSQHEKQYLEQLNKNYSQLEETLSVKKHLEEVQSSMQAALNGTNTMYFEYYPLEHMASEYNGREKFNLGEKLYDYPDSWFKLWFTHPDDVKTLRALYERIDKGAKVGNAEVRIKIGDEYKIIHYRFESIYDENGKRIKVACTASDVTDQNHAEDVLKKERQSLTDVLKNIQAGVIVLVFNKNGIDILDANPAFCNILGTDREKVIGAVNENIFTLAHKDDVPAAKIMVDKLRVPNMESSMECRTLNMKKMKYQWMLISGKSVEQLDGKGYAYVCFTDITASKKMNELKGQLEIEKAANKAKSDFMSNMSHEIRTPMNAIIGMTKLAQDESKDNKELQSYLSKIDTSSNYLLGVINDILDMSRIEEGKLNFNKEWAYPSDVISSCIDMMEPIMKEKGVEFIYDPRVKIKRNIQYNVDVKKTQQMVMNLLNNAYKFTPPGGHVSLYFKNIKLDTSKQTGTDMIVVQDDGCGMSKEFLKKVFTPFEQENNEFSSTYQGTGLGLALSKSIAKARGGDITVESELGKGSTFTIIFPYEYRIVDQKLLDNEAKKKAYDFSPLKGKSVLMAEDQYLNSVIATKLLEKEGMMVTSVSNGKEAVDTFLEKGKGYFDVILMDIRMPVMDGLEASREIRKTDSKIPIIAMTANAFDEDRKASKEAGMNAHLGKPIMPEVVYKTILDLIKPNSKEGK